LSILLIFLASLVDSLKIYGIYRNTQITVVTIEMYLVRDIRNVAHIFLRV
jgi:hypothetical protein